MFNFGPSSRLLLSGSFAFLLMGCSTTATRPSNNMGISNPTPATKIAPGMTINAVEAVLGGASGMKSSTYNPDHICKSYGYVLGGRQNYIDVEYRGGEVIGYQDGQSDSICFVNAKAEDITKHAEEVVKVTK